MPPARRALESAAAPLAGATAGLFAALSAARRKRVFHPDGTAFEGSVTFGVNRDLPFHGIERALVRLSRGIGLPEKAPDILGLAIKLPDLDHDFLFATSGEGALTRHLLVPAGGYFRRPYSSVLPYEVNGKLVVFGARADAFLAGAPDGELEDLEALVERGRVRFDLTWGPAGRGEIATLGSLELRTTYDGDLAFNPFNTYGAVRPAGALNRLRRESYGASQRARPDTEHVATAST
ncbi:MAG TPA: hypothetical protein VIG64_06435 [Actinomycetota bacterium]|jgi:hypothetical protein